MKNIGVFLFTEKEFVTDFVRFLHSASVFCSKFLSSAVFSSHLTYDTVGHAEVLLFGNCRCLFFFTGLYRYSLVNSITLHDLNPDI